MSHVAQIGLELVIFLPTSPKFTSLSYPSELLNSLYAERLCLSYFSVAVKRYRDQDNLIGSVFMGSESESMAMVLGSMVAGRQANVILEK